VHQEFAAGAVIFREENNRIWYLLIYSQRNRIWGFPKGHIEDNENEKTAALREIEEETGLTALHFIDGFREEDIYPATSNRGAAAGQTIEKHSIYYLAKTNAAIITVDNDEISDYRWLPYEKACALLPFEGIRRILQKAHLSLRPHDKNE
jgi:8-oxo-dGTP pyrophosphatase MutT (NUDIX family)